MAVPPALGKVSQTSTRCSGIIGVIEQGGGTVSKVVNPNEFGSAQLRLMQGLAQEITVLCPEILVGGAERNTAVRTLVHQHREGGPPWCPAVP